MIKEITCAMTQRPVTLFIEQKEARGEGGYAFAMRDGMKHCNNEGPDCDQTCECIKPRHPFAKNPETGARVAF